MDICGQLSLFDADFIALTESLPKRKAEIKPVLMQVDYLKKGERITDLAREKFERKYGETFKFTDFEEKILSAKYGELTSPYSQWTRIDVLKPVAMVFRKLLRTIKEVSDTDEGVKTLKEIFNEYYDLTIEESPTVKPYHITSGIKGGDICLRVTLREGNKRQVSHGLSYSSHSAKRRNAIWSEKAKEGYHEGCTDLAYYFAYLYVLMVVSKEINRAKAEETIFYYKNSAIFEERYEAVFPYAFTFESFLGEDYFNETEIHFLEYVLKRKNIGVISRYEALNKLHHEGKTRLSREDYKAFKKVNEIANIFNSPGEDRISPFMQTEPVRMRLDPNLYRSMPSYGVGIGVWYALFLDIIEEKAEDLRTYKYLEGLKKSVATAYQTKKNIPDKILTAMKESEFNNTFGYVEIDQDVEISKVSEIAKEFMAVKEAYFSGVDASDKTLRFRKLGKHKALGLYYPFFGCLCVDIHSPSSFIHEWGHLLDYKYGRLSKKIDFYDIRKIYERLVDKAMEGNESWNGNTKYNRSYYLEPTEIFARSFEIYMSRILGVKNSLLSEPCGFAYPEDDNYLNLVKRYFDEIFIMFADEKAGKEDIA